MRKERAEIWATKAMGRKAGNEAHLLPRNHKTLDVIPLLRYQEIQVTTEEHGQNPITQVEDREMEESRESWYL